MARQKLFLDHIDFYSVFSPKKNMKAFQEELRNGCFILVEISTELDRRSIKRRSDLCTSFNTLPTLRIFLLVLIATKHYSLQLKVRLAQNYTGQSHHNQNGQLATVIIVK